MCIDGPASFIIIHKFRSSFQQSILPYVISDYIDKGSEFLLDSTIFSYLLTAHMKFFHNRWLFITLSPCSYSWLCGNAYGLCFQGPNCILNRSFYTVSCTSSAWEQRLDAGPCTTERPEVVGTGSDILWSCKCHCSLCRWNLRWCLLGFS